MLFSIDEDAGTRIVGWIMPDNPSSTPHVAVFVGGKMHKVVRATVLRPLLREQGLHETGICGFVVDQQAVPDLAKLTDVELYDEATNIRIYRRRPETAKANLKLFRLETRAVPQAAMNEPFQDLFHMAFTRLEQTPEEAVRSILGIAFSPSIFCTGRLYFRTFEPLLTDRGFKCTVLVRNPFEEMAEQLLALRWAVRTPNLAYSVLHETFRPLVESLGKADVKEMTDFEGWLGTLGPAERGHLSNPLARLLTCRSSDEAIEASAVEQSLQTLSDMDVVGVEGSEQVYWDTLRAVLEIDLPPLPSLSWSRHVGELERLVRDWPAAQDLIAADAGIFSALQEAIRRTDATTEEAVVEPAAEPAVAS